MYSYAWRNIPLLAAGRRQPGIAEGRRFLPAFSRQIFFRNLANLCVCVCVCVCVQEPCQVGRILGKIVLFFNFFSCRLVCRNSCIMSTLSNKIRMLSSKKNCFFAFFMLKNKRLTPSWGYVVLF